MPITLSQSVKEIYKRTKEISQLMNIIEFCESSSGLGIKLFPVQRFIFKVFYAIPLDDDIVNNPIQLTDDFNESVIKEFTSEIEFFKYLYIEGRINISYEEWSTGDFLFIEIVFVIGRRGSKTTMTSIITCYTLYLLLSLDDPHKYFGIMESDTIGVALVSNHSENAHKQYMAISDLLMRSRFFARFIRKSVAGQLWLASEAYKELQEKGDAAKAGNILVTSFSASPSVRGSSNIVVVMDEFDHFPDADTHHKDMRLAEKVYEALVPSISGFIDPKTRKAVGKSFVISSPNGTTGEMYKLYKKSFESKDILMLQMPSNWVNPKVAPQILRAAFNKSETSFRQEYGAHFNDKQGDWIDEKKLFASIDVGNLNVPSQKMDVPHSMGFDLAVRGDRAVISVGHCSDSLPTNYMPKDEKLSEALLAKKGPYYIIDYVKIYKPENYATGMIPVEEVISDIEYLFTRFRIVDGSYDQYSGGLFTQLLEKKPKIRLSYEPANMYNNSERAKTMRLLFNEGRIILPYIEDMIVEFQNLKEEVRRDGVIRVHNDFGHDDIYSSISRCIEKLHKKRILSNASQPAYVGGRKGLYTRAGRYIHTGNSSRDAMLRGRI